MMKFLVRNLIWSLVLIFAAATQKVTNAQSLTPAQEFWAKLRTHCGKAYEGRLGEGIVQPDFEGKRLLMHVRSCGENTIRIPFVVGEDLSRTWILTYDPEADKITLKHDHRHEDGTPDEVTQYGGQSPNTGFAHLQIFPADEETAAHISYASSNVWWITLDDALFTYNLRRLGTDRLFTVEFDLSKDVAAPPAPWGWED